MRHFNRACLLPLFCFLMILSWFWFGLLNGTPFGVSLYLFIGAGLAILVSVLLLQVSLFRPLAGLKHEMMNFSRTWLTDAPEGFKDMDEISKGLIRIHDKVDKTTFRVKELEATINVFSIEKKQMETILRSLPIGVLITDRFNELILANDVARKLFCLKAGECQGQSIGNVLQWQELVDLIHETSNRKVKVPRRRMELPYQPEEGDPKVLRMILSSITDNTDQVLGVVTIIQDATKDREIDRMKSEFVANVSHELKAPLASIKAYTEMLIDGEASDADTQREFCSIIEAEANRLSNMIDNLLDISRLEAGVVQMNMERVNLIKMLNSVADTMRPSAEKKNITMSTDISQYIVPVQGDKDQLNRVLVNLVSNAIKYTPEGKTIDLTARLEGDLIRIDVADTGYGIPEDALPRIFEKFYRVKENSRFAKGTGMGLAMVKRILEIHNAEIKVKSKPGEGSCFSVFIPAAE
ncbi:MAG: ATP-binding protein [Planctomycetota bacterium]